MKGSRGACPLCGSSGGRQAFSVRGKFWKCFACGLGGDAINLEAALGGISKGDAIKALAARLGFSSVTPADAARIKEASARRRELRTLDTDLEKALLRAHYRQIRRLESQIARVSARGCTPLTWHILWSLYRQLSVHQQGVENR